MLKQMHCTIGLAAIALASISVGSWETPAVASDHTEAPATQADSTVELTDLYVFGSGDGKTTLIACWDGLSITEFPDAVPFAQKEFNQDALYAFNIDNDGDNVEDIVIYWRYGQDQFGNVAIRWEGVPGAGENVVALIDETVEAGEGTRVWTGIADDPFFFDAGAYLAVVGNGTLFDENGDLYFTGADFLAGLNVKAAAIELDTSLLQNEDEPGPIQVWITLGDVVRRPTMKNIQLSLMASVLFGAMALAACGDDSGTGGAGSGGDATTTSGTTSTSSSTGTPTTTSGSTGGEGGEGEQGPAGPGGAGGEGGSGGEAPVFVFSDAAYEDYSRVNRHGAVEAGTAGIAASEGLGDETTTVRDDYNASNPLEDSQFDWIAEISASVAFFRALDGDLTAAGFTPATNEDTLDQAGGVLIPDTIKYDPEQPTSYPNGRALTDPTVDITLSAALLQWGTDPEGAVGEQGPATFVGILNPTENDVPFDDAFPFLAPPHEVE